MHIVLFHILDDAISLAGSLVLAELALLVHTERRITLDFLLSAKVLMVGAVDGGDLDAVLLQRLRGLGVFGREVLAMAAPISVELYEHGHFAFDNLVKGGGGEFDDIGVIEGLFHVRPFQGDGGRSKQGGREGEEGGRDDAHSVKLHRGGP